MHSKGSQTVSFNSLSSANAMAKAVGVVLLAVVVGRFLSAAIRNWPEAEEVKNVVTVENEDLSSGAEGTTMRLSAGGPLATSDHRQLLLFQLQTSDPALIGHPETPHVGDKRSMSDFADELIGGIGERGDGKRQLGMMFGPVSWDLTDEQIRTQIREAFEVAEEKNIAVGFHIEDSMYWNKRKDLWSDKNNVEWSDWNGTVVPHRHIGFITDPKALAPPMCYNSPAIVAETRRRARDVIGSEIRKGVDHLKSKDKANLFAGVIVGWETRMQDDSFPPNYYGYCALHNLGYSESNPPPDINKALEQVVANWIALWATSIEQAGIAKEDIFMHIAYPGPLGLATKAHLKAVYGLSTDSERDFYKGASLDLLKLKTNTSPGFSVYGMDTFPSLLQFLDSIGNPRWSICEGNAIDLAKAFSHLSDASSFTSNTKLTSAQDYVPSASMEQFLAFAYNHGATFVNLFGWDKSHADAAFAAAVMGPASIVAYRKFLKGQSLSETAASAAIPPVGRPGAYTPPSFSSPPGSPELLAEKVARIQSELPAWLKTHESRKPELAMLFQQLDARQRARDMNGAQSTADAILRLIESN